MSDERARERAAASETMLEAAHRQAEHNEAVEVIIKHLAPILAEFEARLERVELALAEPAALDALVRRVVEERLGTITTWRARIEGRMQRFEGAVLAKDEPELLEQLRRELDRADRQR
jgi:hypothetical protein